MKPVKKYILYYPHTSCITLVPVSNEEKGYAFLCPSCLRLHEGQTANDFTCACGCEMQWGFKDET